MRKSEKYEFREKARDSKLEQLRKLDYSVHYTATMISITVGIAGMLLLGFGLSCVLVWGDSLFAAGIVAEITGIIMVISAMPVYSIVEQKRMKKIAPEIIKLTDELLNNDSF